MWGFDNIKNFKLELQGVSNDKIYIWPERGDVYYYFLQKLAPKGQIADCIREER